MNFDELPRLPNIDELLKEWYNVTDIQEIDIKVKSDKRVQEQINRNNQIALEELRKCE